MANRLDGTWLNGYGSVMVITVDDAGFFEGSYSSHTGDVGTYRVIGLTDIHSRSGNQALSLSILWRPFDAEGDDPGYHSISVMAGQLQMIDDADVITLNHLLVQETAPGDNWQSTFIDKLIFRRQGSDGFVAN